MHVWINEELHDNATSAQSAWRRQQLESELALLGDRDGRVTLEPVDETAAGASVKLASIIAFGGRRAALVTTAAGDIRLNGSRPLPVVVLADRDEITVPGARLRIAAFADAAAYVIGNQRLRCARCKNLIISGAVVRACPACTSLYHSTDSLPAAVQSAEVSPPCYDYEPRCASCRRLWASMGWSPEDENAERF